MNTRRHLGISAGFLLLLLAGFGRSARAQSSPVPLINQPLVPDAAAPGGPGFTLTVNGTGFVPQSIVEWNRVGLMTVDVSGEQLTASVPASEIAKAGTASVTVVNPGAPASNVMYFSIEGAQTAIDFGSVASLTGLYGADLVVAGDFNNDRVPDLLLNTGSIVVLLGNGNGTFQAPIVTYPTQSIGALAVGDFNSDGKLDILAGTGDYYGGGYGVQVFLGNGDGTFTEQQNTYGSLPQGALFTGDFNADGKLDFGFTTCVEYEECTLSLYLGNGDGTFVESTTNPESLNAEATLVGDFDGDGKLDLVIPGSDNVNYNPELEVLIGNGDGTFQPPVFYPLSTDYLTEAVAADFNGDGKLDVAVATELATVAILIGNGNGTFQAPVTYPTAQYYPYYISAADLNGDGKLDLATVNYYGQGLNTISVLLGNGNGTFQTHTDFPVGSAYSGLVAADFNSDGRIDLATGDYSTNSVSLLFQITTTLMPSSLTFDDQDVGTSSPPQTATLTNYSGSALTINSIALNGRDPQDFSQTNTCGSSVPPNSTCTINVTFKPLTTGNLTATLSVSDSDPTSPQIVAVTGYGVTPGISLSPSSLTFPVQLINTTSSAQIITLSSTGTGPLNISSIAASAGFLQTNNCGSSVPPYTSCSISVQFDPTQTGLQTGSISVTDNASGSPQMVPLSGTGTAVLLAPSGVYFGSLTVGTTSAPVPFTLTNEGSSLLTINSITLGGTDPIDFGETNNCGSSLSAGTSCTINATFKPLMTGSLSATLSISDSDPASPQTASLSGTGLPGPSALPEINQPVVPDAATPGGAAFTLTVHGTGFFSGSVVNWNGNPRTTTFVSSTQLTAAILASDIANPGTASVTVSNPAPGGGVSNAVPFDITTPTSYLTFSRTDLPVGMAPAWVISADLNNDGKPDLVATNGKANTISVLLGNGNGTFASQVTYATGSAPYGVTAGDFNGDGNLDLAVANHTSSSVSILLGNGNGTFQSPVSYAAGTGAQSIAVGDFNQDGKLDLAVENGGGTISILLGNGDGTFQAAVNYSTGVGPSWVVTIDFNGDGKLDLATANYTAGTASILLGNGDGTFQAHVDYPVGSQPLLIAAADLNGDGKPDLAVTNGASNNVSILIGNGDGTFQDAANYATGIEPFGVAIGDLNGDGKLDLAVANETSSTVSVLLGNGDGTFQSHVDFAAGIGSGGAALADFNGDGRLDVATSNRTANTLSVLLQANGVSVSPPSLNFGNQMLGTSSAAENITLSNTGSAPLAISSITITGSNSGDFSQTNACPASLTGGSSCTISVAFTPTMLGSRSASLSITDNGPGSPQMVSLTGTGTGIPAVTLSATSLTFEDQRINTSSPAQNVTLTNTGNATLTITSISISGTNSTSFSQTNTCGSTVAAGGTCTISVTFTPAITGALTASVSLSDNAPGSPQAIGLTGTGTSSWATSPTGTIDFYGDGKGEPAVWRPSSGTWYALSNGSGFPNLTQVQGLAGDVPVAGDYDGDGKDDFSVWRPSNGNWYIIPSSNPTKPITAQWGSPDDVPVPADYDGDGVTDIAVWRPGNGTFYVILSSTGKSASQQWGLAGDVPVTGDYDGDGKSDYAVYRPSNGTWYVLQSSTGKTVTTSWGSPGDVPVEGDYDGDGKTDYAIWRSSNATFYVTLSGNGVSETQEWGETGDIPVVGDYNGDHKNDFAVFRPSNGTWYTLYSGTGQTVTQQWGATGDVPANRLPSMYRRDKHIANFDGDRKTDIGVFRPSNGTWYVIDSSTGKSVSQQWGANGDVPVPGDYDGDGKTDYAVWRPSSQIWYVLLSSSGKTVTQLWGSSTDTPVPDDYDGDGKTDYAVWRSSNHTWYVIFSGSGQSVSEQWGATGDIPVPADYDGDGKTDYAVFRPSNGTWYVLLSSSGKTVTQAWGESGDLPVPGDYDGDAKADFTFFRPSTGTWYTLLSSSGKTVTTTFGLNGDIPVAKDYDGDEKADIAVWRPSNGTWYILQSSTGKTASTQWGVSTDVPVNKPTGQ